MPLHLAFGGLSLGSGSQWTPGSSRPTTSAGLYGDQIDEDVAYRVGRAFARVLADLEGTSPSRARVGLGRDMRLSAPAMAERYADGMRDEGASVLDVGMVGTEMLYFTVGSRDLDGGLMCTASHNPKAYTGAKLVRRGAIALSGDAGIGEVRATHGGGEPGPPADPRGELRAEDVAAEFQAAALKFIDPTAVRPMKVVLDGGNGMAGPMVGPVLDPLPIDQVQTYWTPDGEFPDHEPNPLLPENRRFIIKQGAVARAPSSASPGTATPTAASSSTTPASSSTATSSPRCSPSRSSRRSRAPRSSTTCARAARCRTWWSAPAARR